MAFSSIWITVASILATMDITKTIDANGNVVEPSGEYESLTIQFVCSFYNLGHSDTDRMPKPFKCSIKPRSKQAEAAVRSSLEE